MESTLPEYATAGVVRERHGSTVSGIVPTNVYPCADGHYIIIGGNADSIFRRLMRTIGRSDLADDPRLATNDGRVPHAQLIDEAISAWTSTQSYDGGVRSGLDAADVPCGPIYSVADQLHDPHFAARGLIEHVTVDTGEDVAIPAIAPQLSHDAWTDNVAGATTRRTQRRCLWRHARPRCPCHRRPEGD